MRALPVHRDTIDLLVTAAFISSPDTALQPRGSLAIVSEGRAPQRVLAGADQMGQLLWDENYASVRFAEKCAIAAPLYEWRPVAELMTSHVEVEQVLQIERSRLYLMETSCHHPEWDDSAARTFLRRLGLAVESRLAVHPRVLSPEVAGVVEYEGLSRAVDDWQRTVGFRDTLNVAAAQKLSEGQL
jgi:hypothetical protein